jgi:hypothetical protein
MSEESELAPVQAEPGPELEYGDVESILAAVDIDEEDFPVPEWGCKLRLRGLSKAEQFAIRREAAVGQKAGTINEETLEILMFLAGVVKPKFGREHFGRLKTKNSGVMDRVLMKITKLSGNDVSSIEEAKAQFS